MRLRLSAMLLALVLGALSAFAVACGEEREGLISASRAEAMQDDLDAIDEQVAAGRCEAVRGRLTSLRKEVQDLPGSVDADLRRELRDGVTRLEEQAPDECDLDTKTTTTDTTPTTPTVPETTPETVPETTPQTTPQTTPTTPQTTPTTPPQTTPVEPPTQTVPGTGTPEEPAPDPGGEQAPEGTFE